MRARIISAKFRAVPEPVPETLLLVDDDADAVTLFKRAFDRAGIAHPLNVASSANEAIAYLNGEGKYRDRAAYPLPALVLLDVKMPGRGGFEVLEWIRKSSSVVPIRVIMLTGSPSQTDVNRAYQMGANSYVTKPVDLGRLQEILSALCAHWLRDSESPQLN